MNTPGDTMRIPIRAQISLIAALAACTPHGQPEDLGTTQDTSGQEDPTSTGFAVPTTTDTESSEDMGMPVAEASSESGVPLPFCGDNIMNLDEDCDDGPMNSDNAVCTSTCHLASCGDGKVREGVEQCDDANLDETDACLSTCEAARCGDMHVQTGVETCEVTLKEGEPEVIGDGCDACQLAPPFCAPRPEGDALVADPCFVCLQTSPCCAEWQDCLDHTDPFVMNDECMKKFECTPGNHEAYCKDGVGSQGWDLHHILTACLMAAESDCVGICGLKPLP